MKEPTRLRESDRLPSALRDAFRALERDAPSSDTVARVQRALEALPAAAPGAAAGALGLGKLFVVATVVAGAATAVVLMRDPDPGPPPARPAEHASGDSTQQAPHDSRAEPPRPAHATTAGAAGARAPVVAPAADTESAARDQPPSGKRVSQPSRKRVQRRRERAAPSRRARSRGGAREGSPAVARLARESIPPGGSSKPVQSAIAGETAPKPAEALPQAVEAAPEPARPHSADDPVSTVRLDPPLSSAALAGSQHDLGATELELLSQAKRLAESDPEAALRRVQQLARRYPEGVFVEEREVLAIQLHQRLGRAAEAERLTRRFYERYPNSVYRRVLSP